VGFGVSIAHKADVGGLVPGSSGAASRSIFHDGLRLPPVRYRSTDGINEAVEDIIRTNSRAPDVVIGDLNGQVGATWLGAERLAALCEEYGRETILEVMEALLSLTACRLSQELAALPDGTAEAEGFLDDDGADRDRPVRIAVLATKSADSLRLDFSSSAPQTEGPINVNPATARAVSLLAVVAATDPSIPLNSGLNDPVEFVLPDGRIVNPRPPASISHYFPTSVMIYTVVLSALGKLNPRRAVAPSGMVTGAMALGYTGRLTGNSRVQYELGTTALGGTSRGDGAAILHPMNHFTAGSPVEIIESEYPIRVKRFDFWPDSGGAGQYRGGVGVVKEYELLDDATMTLRTTLHRQRSWGLHGGLPPATSRTTVDPGRSSEQRLSALETRSLLAGTIVRLERSGGGGWGKPTVRDPEAVLGDVLDGLVSLEAAYEIYGVVIDSATLVVDVAATVARRKAMAP
jgi:N-methylhydantoinase B